MSDSCPSIQARPPQRGYQFRPWQHLSKDSGRTAESSQVENQHVPNKSTGTQCDISTTISSGGISLDDLHLFHHFTVATYKTVVDEVNGYNLWQIRVPQWSASFPSILHLILALSALHLSHERPDLREAYIQQADNHFTFGVRSITAILSQLDEGNCQKVYISTVLICFVYFGRGPHVGEYLVFSDRGPAEWIMLMHGVKLVLQSFREKIFCGILRSESGSFIRGIKPSLQSEWREHATQIQKVKSLVEQEISDNTDRFMYVSAIYDLLSTLNEVYENRSTEKASVDLMQVLMGWLYRLPGEFVSFLERKEPLSLVVFAHWAVLLQYMRSVWFMKGWDAHILSGIRSSLHPDFQSRIEWPLRQVQRSK